MTDPGLDIFELALACYRAPLSHQDRLAAAAPLPPDMTRLLWLANGSPETLESAIRQTGAKVDELCAAARFLVQQLCFARDASLYRVLGLEPGATVQQLKEHHRLLMRLFHPDRTGGEGWTDHFASRVNEAWTVLSRPQSRVAYDARRSQSPSRVIVPVATRPTESPPVTPVHPPGRRRRLSVRCRARAAAPRRWLPGLVLGGFALAAVLAVWGIYETRPQAAAPTGPALVAGPVATEPESFADSADRSAIAALLTAPDWQALGQRERHARQQASDSRAAQEHMEQTRRERLAADEALLEQMRVERTRLEEQLRAEQLRAERIWSERLVAEQAKLERLKAEQAQAEQARSERLVAGQAKLEELQAEQASAERLAEALRTEREQAERTRLGRVRPEPVRQAEPAGESRLAAAPDAGAPTIQELDELIGRYADAYRRGDLDRLMALFAADARGKEGVDLDRIRRDYGTLFGAHWIRRMQLHDLRWAYNGGSASAVGRYEVWLRRRDTGASIQLAGTIRFAVSKRDGQPSIVAIDYDWPGH